MSNQCIFCKIIAGEIPGAFVHRDDDVVVIEDVNPQAPRHLLVMPVKHIANLAESCRSSAGTDAEAVCERRKNRKRTGRRRFSSRDKHGS